MGAQAGVSNGHEPFGTRKHRNAAPDGGPSAEGARAREKGMAGPVVKTMGGDDASREHGEERTRRRQGSKSILSRDPSWQLAEASRDVGLITIPSPPK